MTSPSKFKNLDVKSKAERKSALGEIESMAVHFPRVALMHARRFGARRQSQQTQEIFAAGYAYGLLIAFFQITKAVLAARKKRQPLKPDEFLQPLLLLVKDLAYRATRGHSLPFSAMGVGTSMPRAPMALETPRTPQKKSTKKKSTKKKSTKKSTKKKSTKKSTKKKSTKTASKRRARQATRKKTTRKKTTRKKTARRRNPTRKKTTRRKSIRKRARR